MAFISATKVPARKPAMNLIGKTLLTCLLLWPSAATVNAQEDAIAEAPLRDEPFALRLPISGEEGVHWVISQYYDHDPSGGVSDYHGGEKIITDGHDGIDFSIPSFRWMDYEELYVFVRAADSGRVVDLHDGSYDRNTSCTGTSNFVIIEHPNGFLSLYYHLKKGSVEVSIGQEVTAGHTLGVVGSSGCSNEPHLHFELKDRHGRIVDPFLEGLWEDPPSYELPTSIMDYGVIDRKLVVEDLKDPPPNIDSITPGKGVIGISVSIAEVKEGDTVMVILTNGRKKIERRKAYDEPKTQKLKGWNINVDKSSGTWHIAFYINDEPTGITHKVRVSRN